MSEIQKQQKELETKLWDMANTLRGSMEAGEFKNYILSVIFYYYLSLRTEKYMEKALENDHISYEEAWKNDELREGLIRASIRDLGYVMEPDHLFHNIIKKIGTNGFDMEFMQTALNSIIDSTKGEESEDAFRGLFDDISLNSPKLGSTNKEREEIIVKLFASVDALTFDLQDAKMDVLGNTYEYLIGKFAESAGKKAGEFYTPPGPAKLLCMLASVGLTDVKSAADPTCGSGSLLLHLRDYVNVRLLYGQEKITQTMNLARMNMILRGVPYQNFMIFNGDTLVNDNFLEEKFHIQVANPPYSSKYTLTEDFKNDPRFNFYGKFPPKSRADYAFLQHMIYHMDDSDGRIAVLLPHGVLFRKNGEDVIRKNIIENQNLLDAVIGLPANLFYGAPLPVALLVLKKNRSDNNDNILFIDASKEFKHGKNKNELTEENIKKIYQTYIERKDVEKYAHVATMDEIRKNDFNLNIPRYVDTYDPEPEIVLSDVEERMAKRRQEIASVSEKLKDSFAQLELKFPF